MSGDRPAAWIRTIAPGDAFGPLAAVYARIGARPGDVANILRSQSLDPESLGLHYELYRHLMYGASPLSRAQREAIAVTVSHENHCHY